MCGKIALTQITNTEDDANLPSAPKSKKRRVAESYEANKCPDKVESDFEKSLISQMAYNFFISDHYHEVKDHFAYLSEDPITLDKELKNLLQILWSTLPQTEKQNYEAKANKQLMIRFDSPSESSPASISDSISSSSSSSTTPKSTPVSLPSKPLAPPALALPKPQPIYIPPISQLTSMASSADVYNSRLQHYFLSKQGLFPQGISYDMLMMSQLMHSSLYKNPTTPLTPPMFSPYYYPPNYQAYLKNIQSQQASILTPSNSENSLPIRHSESKPLSSDFFKLSTSNNTNQSELSERQLKGDVFIQKNIFNNYVDCKNDYCFVGMHLLKTVNKFGCYPSDANKNSNSYQSLGYGTKSLNSTK